MLVRSDRRIGDGCSFSSPSSTHSSNLIRFVNQFIHTHIATLAAVIIFNIGSIHTYLFNSLIQTWNSGCSSSFDELGEFI